MIKGVILDVDGTLLDSMEIWETVGARYLKNMKVEPEKGLREILFTMSIREGASYMKETYHLDRTVDEVIQGVKDTVRDYYYYETPLKLGVADFLENLSRKNVPMVVATASEKAHLEVAFERLHIAQYFDRIFTCSEVGASKREPAIYLKAAEYLNAEPGEICVFEDVTHALKTAKMAGFKTVGVYDKYSIKDKEEMQRQSDLYLEDMTEFDKFWKYVSEECVSNRKEEV